MAEIRYFKRRKGKGFYQVCWGRISRCEEGKRISWLLGKKKTLKNGKEKQYHLPYNIKAVGKNNKRRKGRKFGEEKSRF